ncbi:MAG: hypothetical protein IPP71_09310 [Bacteroidetes bacterium]|nr:hypothetical protein [Bacteroidota bacterium]
MRLLTGILVLFTLPHQLMAGGIVSCSFPESKAEAIIKRIISTVGLKPDFEVEPSELYDASATVINGKRVIYYNPAFFEKLQQQTGSEWASISILAHEIGHHLNGHTLMGGKNSPEIELEADEFSGFVLQKMGATLTEAQQAIKKISHNKDSKTHPAKDKRLIAIEKGWSKAAALINTPATTETAELKLPEKLLVPADHSKAVNSKPVRSPVSKSNYIRYTVKLHSQPGMVYYLTAQNNLVRFYENNFYIVGTIRSTGKTNYPYVISGNHSNFYVSKNGALVDSNGKAAGYVKIYKG